MYMYMYVSVHVVHIVLPEHGLPAEVHGDGVESHRVGADERERPLGARPSLPPRQVDAGYSGRCVCSIEQCSVVEGSQYYCLHWNEYCYINHNYSTLCGVYKRGTLRLIYSFWWMTEELRIFGRCLHLMPKYNCGG